VPTRTPAVARYASCPDLDDAAVQYRPRNWPRVGATGANCIGTREGIGDSGKRVPILNNIQPGPMNCLFEFRLLLVDSNASASIPSERNPRQNDRSLQELCGSCSRYSVVPSQDRRTPCRA